MLPFRTNLTIFIIEFLCSVLLQTFYAVSEYGVERAFLAALGLIPVLLVFLISYHIENEKVVVFLGLNQKKNVYLQMLRHVMSERNCAVN